MNARADGLTIISVYHNKLSQRLLELNRKFTHALNLDVNLHWFVADNTPLDFVDPIDKKDFVVFPNKKDYHGLGSHQHADGINLCLKEVKTRFVVSLDSDFYIVRPHWIDEVTRYMEKNNLAFFGVSYHTRDYPKYRYFPSVVCMFIDLQKVSLNTVDFSPLMEFKESGQVIRTEKDRETKKKILRKKIKNFLPQVFVHVFSKLMRTVSIRQRKMVIATMRDTGYRIYVRYGDDERFKRECVTVVFDPHNETYLHQRVWRPLNWIVEMLLPDYLCYIPKKKQSFSSEGFKEKGFSHLRGFGWEEYMWHGKPFGTHIRGSKTWKRNKSEDDEIRLIKQGLNTFI